MLAADKLYRSAEYAKTLSDMEDEIQILPWPKLDEKQTKYVTTAKGDMYITVVPDHKKATKGEAISAYLQYSNELAYVARDAYVYELLGIEDADDEVATATQRRMLDIIIDSTSFDAADIYADLDWQYDTVDNCWAYNMIDANDRYDFKRISGDTKIFGNFSFQTIP